MLFHLKNSAVSVQFSANKLPIANAPMLVITLCDKLRDSIIGLVAMASQSLNNKRITHVITFDV